MAPPEMELPDEFPFVPDVPPDVVSLPPVPVLLEVEVPWLSSGKLVGLSVPVTQV